MSRVRRVLTAMGEMTPEVANSLFALANLAAIIGGVLVVLGAAGIFFIGNIRENYASQEQARLAARTAEAQRGAAEANEKAAKSNEEGAKLRLELERERGERLKLEQRMAPRRVSEELRAAIKRFVTPDAETKFYLAVGINNAEGDRLINEIGGALLDAGWPREQLDGSTVVGANFPDGVTVCINPSVASTMAEVPPIPSVLAAVLAHAGLASATPIIVDADTPIGTVKLAAGFKPGRDG